MKMVVVVGILPALFFTGCDFEQRVAADMTSTNQSQPLGNEKSLQADIRFDIGSMELNGEKGSDLYTLDLEYDKATYNPDISYRPPTGSSQEGRLSFRLQSNHKLGLRTDGQHNRLRLSLNDAVPLELKLNMGVGDSRLALSGMKVSRLDLEAGVGQTKISAYEPNPIVCDYVRMKSGVGSMEAVGLGNLNFRELEFEGGVGGANLDFTGEWKQDAEIGIQVGVGGVSVKMPRNIGVRVEAQKHFLSGLHLENFNRHDSYYYSDNYDKVKTRVTLRVTTGVGGFKITWL
jgi:hypothetical protein